MRFDPDSMPLRPVTADPRLEAWSSRPPQNDNLEDLPPAPTQVKIRSPVHGMLIIDSLAEDATAITLKSILISRLRISLGRRLHISSWGNELPESLTLQECRLRTNCVLDLKMSLLRVADENGGDNLTRVRIASTALETRTIGIHETTTGLQLKQQIESFLARGEYEWYGKKVSINSCTNCAVRTTAHISSLSRIAPRQGETISACGATVLAMSHQPAEEKTGVAAVRQGDEFVTATPFAGEGKGKAMNVYRAKNGEAVAINDNNVVLLVLPPEKQRLTFHGRDLPDDAMLWGHGIRQDDVIMLEFASPTMPNVLQILRAPDKPKAAKKGKGGKGEAAAWGPERRMMHSAHHSCSQTATLIRRIPQEGRRSRTYE